MVRPGYPWAQDVASGDTVQVVGPRRSLDLTRFTSAPIFDLYTGSLHWGVQGGATSAQRALLQLSRGGDRQAGDENVVFWRRLAKSVRLYCKGFAGVVASRYYSAGSG
jgi:hypothetical protein